MALSGSLTAGYWYADNGQSRGYTLNWSATQSIANNQSTITWWVDTAGSYPYTVAERTLTVTLAGQTLINKTDRVMRGAGRVASGSFTVTHDSAGNLSISGSISAAVYYSSVNCSNSTSWSLNQIARQANISTAPNFNDEANPSITYSNPAGNSVSTLMACISLTGSKDDITYRNISKTGTSYTFNLTEAERNILRNACTTANSRNVIFYVRTEIGGNTFYSTLTRTLSIVNANPTFTCSAFDFKQESTELTGGGNKLIKGYNHCQAEFTGVTTLKGATVKSYKITNGNNTINDEIGFVENTENNVFNFELTDTRGNKATKSITLDMIHYIPLTCNVDGTIHLSSTDTESEAELKFTIAGNYFNGYFGESRNSLSLNYAVMDEYDEPIRYGTSTINNDDVTDGTYKVEFIEPALDYRGRYYIKVFADDLIKSIEASSKEFQTTPVFDWGENDFNFNVPVSIQGQTITDFIVEQGTSGMWTYRKWNSGIAECWGLSSNASVAATTTWGSLYTKDGAFPSYSYPFDFVSLPVIQVYPLSSGGNFWLFTGSGASVSQTPEVSVVRATSYTVTARVSYYVIGRWK